MAIWDRALGKRSSALLRPWGWSLRGQVIALCALLIAGLSAALASGERRWLLPGETSDGHHVIEGACHACHAGFASPANGACTACHERELEADTHPTATFEDPRWAGELARVDARQCRSCHAEHARHERNVSAPRALCFTCHDDVVHKRPSHRALAPDSCLSGGCHNYHDNRTLSLAFLQKRLGKPATFRAEPALRWRARSAPPANRDIPPHLRGEREQAISFRWRNSAHARSGVGCERCHGGEGGAKARVERPDERVCGACHGFERDTFQHGKHGARRAVGLPSLEVAQARRAMVEAPAQRALTCGTCHDAHALDTARAASAACLTCHDDPHSRAYPRSAHAARGVTCASCHLPRVVIPSSSGGSRVAVNHDNSFTLAPRDRMARTVCLDCHAIELALSALYDDESVLTNFAHPPAALHRTIEMVRSALESRPLPP